MVAQKLSDMRGLEKGRAYQSPAFNKAVRVGLTSGGSAKTLKRLGKEYGKPTEKPKKRPR